MVEKAQENLSAKETVEQTYEVSLLDQILAESKLARDDYQKEAAKDMIAEFVNQVMSGELKLSKNL
ncbi:MAG: type VI secretion system contractile sheath large subunit, partial [Acidobacteria bacterium]